MKIIHCADIHLGSKIDSRFPNEISSKRKEEIRNSFKRMVDYAKTNNIKVIMLSGDVFESDNPFKKDKDFFISIVKNNHEIDFLYLKGNHDLYGENIEDIPNLKCFSNEWKTYSYENVDISGIEIDNNNFSSFYSTLSLAKEKNNIVMLHGQIGYTVGVNFINLAKLKNKNIDYLALGHIHKFMEDKLDERGVYVYSGCLEGRGFDETGKKGFVEIEINDEIKYRFIPFSERTINELEVDITDIKDAYEAYRRIKDVISFSKENIYRVILKGIIDYEIDSLGSDVEKYLSDDCLFISVKDKTEKKIDISAFEGDLSIRGEFVRSVLANDSYSQEEKIEIITYGLKALNGRSVE